MATPPPRVPPSATASVTPQRSPPPLGALQPRLPSSPPRLGFRCVSRSTPMAAPVSASLAPRVSLPPRARSTASSSRGLGLSSLPGRRHRHRHLRLRRSPSPAGTAAASSASVPSPSGIGDALGGVEIYSAATGEPVLFRDLWDQNEVLIVFELGHFKHGCFKFQL